MPFLVSIDRRLNYFSLSASSRRPRVWWRRCPTLARRVIPTKRPNRPPMNCGSGLRFRLGECSPETHAAEWRLPASQTLDQGIGSLSRCPEKDKSRAAFRAVRSSLAFHSGYPDFAQRGVIATSRTCSLTCDTARVLSELKDPLD